MRLEIPQTNGLLSRNISLLIITLLRVSLYHFLFFFLDKIEIMKLLVYSQRSSGLKVNFKRPVPHLPLHPPGMSLQHTEADSYLLNLGSSTAVLRGRSVPTGIWEAVFRFYHTLFRREFSL